jgi:molybdopterin-guanine dinucleotide biosynthesis protein A
MHFQVLRSAGIVLAGGRSSRMGTSKAAMEWHGSTLLRRVAGVIERAVDGPVLVVRAPGQRLPELPGSILVCEDTREGRGPLQGLAAGLAALGAQAEVVYVSGTDSPLLHPAFVRAVLRGVDGAQAAVPRVGGKRQPLAAAYRTSVAGTLAQLLCAGRLRMGELLERIAVRELDRGTLLSDRRLAECDPALDSLVNVNDAAEYAAARARPAPLVSVRLGDEGERRVLRAATLGEALSRAAVRIAAGEALLLNGEPVAADPQLPLVCGDSVGLTGALLTWAGRR